MANAKDCSNVYVQIGEQHNFFNASDRTSTYAKQVQEILQESEKIMWETDLEKMIDTLAEQAARVESFVRLALLRLQADALAHVMRRADERRKTTKPKTSNDRDDTPAIIRDVKRRGLKMMKRAVRPIIDESRKAKDCSVETYNVRKFAAGMFEAEHGCKDLNAAFSSPLKPQALEACGLAEHGSLDGEAVLWHQRTGIPVNGKLCDRLNDSSAVDSRQETILNVCRVEDFGFVFISSARVRRHPLLEPGQVAFEYRIRIQSSAEMRFDRALPPVTLSAFGLLERLKLDCKLVRSGRDRFLCWSRDAARIVEFGSEVQVLRQFGYSAEPDEVYSCFDYNAEARHVLVSNKFKFNVYLMDDLCLRLRASKALNPTFSELRSGVITDGGLCVIMCQNNLSDAYFCRLFDLRGSALATFPTWAAFSYRFVPVFDSTGDRQLTLLFFSGGKPMLGLRLLGKPRKRRLVAAEKTSGVEEKTGQFSKITPRLRLIAPTVGNYFYLSVVRDSPPCSGNTLFMYDRKVVVSYKISMGKKVAIKRSRFAPLDPPKTEHVNAFCALDESHVVLVINNALLTVVNLQTGSRLNTARFRADNFDEESSAIVSSASPTLIYIATKGKPEIRKVECERGVWNWRVTREFVLAGFTVRCMFFDQRNSRLALVVGKDAAKESFAAVATPDLSVLRHFRCQKKAMNVSFDGWSLENNQARWAQIPYLRLVHDRDSCFLHKSLLCLVTSISPQTAVQVYDWKKVTLVASIRLDVKLLLPVWFVPLACGRRADKLQIFCLVCGCNEKNEEGFYSLNLQFSFKSNAECCTFFERLDDEEER